MTDTPAPTRAHPRARALCSLLLYLLAAPLAAAPDVRVLIDVSGSMRQTDPNNLRRPALRLLTELLPNGSSAGVWLFAEDTEPLIPAARVDAKWKTKTRGQIDRIHSRGSFTDIEQAIATATAGWDTPDPGSERSLILLTDGLVDVAKEGDKSAASRARILSEQLERLRAEQVKVQTIGLSDKVDTDLLRQLSTRTGGWMEVAQDAGALQRAFLHMLEQAAAPTTVPLQGNHFDIDGQVSEFTLLAFHGASGSTSLVSPGGEEFSALTHPAGVSWRGEADYDLVTLTAPKAGRWTLKGVSDPDNRVVVVTDLGIELGGLPNTLAAGAGAHLEAWLTARGQPLTRRDFLTLASADASLTPSASGDAGAPTGPAAAPETPPADHQAAAGQDAAHTAAEGEHGGTADHGAPPSHQAHEPAAAHATPATPAPAHQEARHEETAATPGRFALPLDAESGRFRAELSTKSLATGIYQVQVTIDGGTFKRQATRRLKIAGPPLDIRYAPQLPTEQSPAATLVMTFSAEPDLVDPKTLGGYLLIRGPAGHDAAVDIPAFAKTSLVARLPIATPGNYRIQGRLMARTPSGEPLVFDAPPGDVSFAFDPPQTEDTGQEEHDTGHLSWLALSAYLGGGNAALGGLLGITWWLLRRPVPASGKKTGKRKGA